MPAREVEALTSRFARGLANECAALRQHPLAHMTHAGGAGRMMKITGGAVIQFFAFDTHMRAVDAQPLLRDAHGVERFQMIVRHLAMQHDGQITVL